MPGRDNKACNHLSLLRRPGNYLPIPDHQNRKGKIQLPSAYSHRLFQREIRLLMQTERTEEIIFTLGEVRIRENRGFGLRSFAGIVSFCWLGMLYAMFGVESKGRVVISVRLFHLSQTCINTHRHTQVACQYITSDKRRVTTHYACITLLTEAPFASSAARSSKPLLSNSVLTSAFRAQIYFHFPPIHRRLKHMYHNFPSESTSLWPKSIFASPIKEPNE